MKFLLALLLLSSTLFAKEIKNPVQDHIYKVGETVLDFTLQSQHGQQFSLKPTTKYLWITYDKLSTRKQNVFVAQRKGFLEKTHSLLIADMSVAPKGIFNFFIHPKMKRFRHPLLYSFDVNLSKTFPYKENHITIMKLKKKKVEEIVFINSEEGLKKLFP
jgi:hypothetical protein